MCTFVFHSVTQQQHTLPTVSFHSCPISTMALAYISITTLTLLGLLCILLAMFVILCGKAPKKEGNYPPGPAPWPIIGNMHLLAPRDGSGHPWDSLGALAKRFGTVFALKLGNRSCVVVSSLDAIREVLVSKATSFNARPNFLRYDALFGGDRDNSLALCNWSNVHKVRRGLAFPHMVMRPSTVFFDRFELIAVSELEELVHSIGKQISRSCTSVKLFPKSLYAHACANVFFSYFCGRRFEINDPDFRSMVTNYSLIFDDINSGFAVDFLPWLAPLHAKHFAKLHHYGQEIRQFLLKLVVEPRKETMCPQAPPRDLLDVLLDQTGQQSKCLSLDHALYELEDILGGHAAVACFWIRMLGYIAANEQVQRRIQEEIDRVVGDQVSLLDRPRMPYTEATLLETLRFTSSPIIPHVATEDSMIAGYNIDKDTMVFLNTYTLNMSEKLWKEPHKFDPTRFLGMEGQIVKPEHFMPFSAGKRSCLGYRMVQCLSYLSTVLTLKHFNVSVPNTQSFRKVSRCQLALPDDAFPVIFTRRVKCH